MINIYLFSCFEELRAKCTIDMSKIPAEKLADECDNVLQHHKDCTIFLGYLDVGWMLDSRHEARIRNAIRKFNVSMITFHLESLPYSWKNEIDTLYVQDPKNGHAQIVNDGCAVQGESEAGHGSAAAEAADR